MPFVDKPLTCKDCNESFVFLAAQQEHHAKLGLRNEPKRCMICRQVGRMRNADRIGPRRSPPRDGPREIFMATCAACGRQTDLPFKPRGDRPVYCRDCFRKQR
jgi:CxxC-x17-CxxC domain-containing protein